MKIKKIIITAVGKHMYQVLVVKQENNFKVAVEHLTV